MIETRSSTKVKCPRTTGWVRRCICTVLLCPWRNMDRGKWTPNLVYQRILKLETLGRRVGLHAMSGQMCLFLLKFNQSLFLCISDSMRFFLFGFEDIFIFLRVAILLNSVVGKKIVLRAFGKPSCIVRIHI